MRGHRAWSVRSGDWYGVVGDRATVVLPPSEKARVAAVWELVDAGAGFEETLDALICSGLRDLPGFVLVGRTADATRVLLRGPARAHLATSDEVVHVEGDATSTWVERTLTGVTRLRIEVADPDPDAPDDLLVVGGLVRVATLEQPPVTQVPAEDDDGGGHDGLTRAGRPDPASYARQRPGIPGQEPAPGVTDRPVARLALSSGGSVDVDRVVLVGRAPEPRRDTSTSETRLVAVPSPQQEISSTHLEVRPGSGADHGAAVVTDLGSTNGTLLVQPGLPPEDLVPGVAVQLLPGATIDLGDGVTLRVVDP